MSGLSREQFDALDKNQDGSLSEAELEKIIDDTLVIDDPYRGCTFNVNGTVNQARKYVGDMFLLGVALLTLLGMSGAARRSGRQ